MMNESVKKSLEKSKNVLEEKRKIVKRKICIKKDTHVCNNCYELRSRAINKSPKQFLLIAYLKTSGLNGSKRNSCKLVIPMVRALNARWTLPVYPVFEDEKSKASDEKSDKRKIA